MPKTNEPITGAIVARAYKHPACVLGGADFVIATDSHPVQGNTFTHNKDL